MIYKWIGMVVVRLGWKFVKRRVALRTALMTGAGIAAGITAIGVAGYLATRDVPEG